MSLGLRYASDPDWFYGLSRDAQVRVLAVERVREKA